MSDILNRLMQTFSSKPNSLMLGNGAASNAAALMQNSMSNAYRQHVIDAQTNGEQPMSPNDFARLYQQPQTNTQTIGIRG